MATKKTDKQKTPAKKPKAAPKKVVKAAAPKGEQKPRHPRGRVTALHVSKEALAKSLAESLAKPDEDTGVIADRLRTASNSQLLRLQHVVETVKSKYGDRTKLIAKIGSTENKAKDKDFLAKLDGFSLPQLLDLAQSHEKRTRA
jgi:hypothetical protein